MPTVDSPAGWNVMVDLLLFPVGVLLLFWMYNRLKGIERAAWAIVSQLQAMRREEHDPVQAAQRVEKREAPATTHSIFMSMFGR